MVGRSVEKETSNVQQFFSQPVGERHTGVWLLRWPFSEALCRPKLTPISPAAAAFGQSHIHQVQVAFIGSGAAGGGTFYYCGRSYPFKLGGVSRLDASGNVYNLYRLRDFDGVSGQARTGWALGEQGKGRMWLQNGNGVYLRLKARRQGRSLSLGADGMVVRLRSELPMTRFVELLRRVRRRAAASGLEAGLIGRSLSPFDLIVYEAAGQTGGGADAGAEPGVAGDGADDRAATGADRRARQGALLSRGHVRATGQRHRGYRRRDHQLSHRTLRLFGVSAGHGYLPAR
jgi:hypothetical protein